MKESGGIICLTEPIIVDINAWMNENEGIVAVGHKLSDRKKTEIYAYCKSGKPTAEISRLARKNESIMLVNCVNGFTDLDEMRGV